MKFPSKVTKIHDSIVYKMTLLLERIDAVEKYSLTVNELYGDLRDHFSNTIDFIEALDCLYALNRIDINEEDKIYAK